MNFTWAAVSQINSPMTWGLRVCEDASLHPGESSCWSMEFDVLLAVLEPSSPQVCLEAKSGGGTSLIDFMGSPLFAFSGEDFDLDLVLTGPDDVFLLIMRIVMFSGLSHLLYCLCLYILGHRSGMLRAKVAENTENDKLVLVRVRIGGQTTCELNMNYLGVFYWKLLLLLFDACASVCHWGIDFVVHEAWMQFFLD